MSPEIAITDEPGRARYAISVDGRPGGFLTYRLEPGQISFMHAEVDPGLESRGLGSRLTEFALRDARSRGLTVLPFCPFVSAYIQGRDEYRDLVPASRRGRFGL